MKETNEIKIKYRTGVKDNNALEKEYTYDTFRAETSHTKRFNAAVCLLMGINGCAHHLIDYLSNNAGESGYVNNNGITRQSFIDFHKRHKGNGNKPYSNSAVEKAFIQLADKDFLIPIIKGVFKVNPVLYFNGESEERVKKIKMMLEFTKGVDTKFITEVSK